MVAQSTIRAGIDQRPQGADRAHELNPLVAAPGSKGRWPLSSILHTARLRSFGAAFCGSVAVLLALVTWAFVDESFSVVLMSICVKFDLERVGVLLGITTSPVYGWEELGPRFVLLGVLTLLAVAFNLLVAYRLFFGNRNARSLRSLLLAVALVGMWLTPFLSYQGLAEAGHRWRIRGILPYLKEDASALLADWPQTPPITGPDGSPIMVVPLLFSGLYAADFPDDPNCLLKHSSSQRCPFSKHTGPLIWKTADNGIRFQIQDDISVEYHPDGSKPQPFNQTIDTSKGTDWTFDVGRFEELEQNWFLVWHSIRPASQP